MSLPYCAFPEQKIKRKKFRLAKTKTDSSHFQVDSLNKDTNICTGYYMRGEVVLVLSLEGRYHIVSRVSAAKKEKRVS